MSSHGSGAMSAAMRTRLVQLLGMLDSAHDGERANAAALADRLVRDAGLTLDEVIAPAGTARGLAPVGEGADVDSVDETSPLTLGENDLFDLGSLQMDGAFLTEKQRTLVEGFRCYLKTHAALTSRQREVLDELIAKARRRRRAA